MLRACALQDKSSWDKRLPYAQFSYNSRHHASLKMSPFQALYGNFIALGPTWRKAGIWSRHFAWSRGEHQNSLGESEDSAVQAAKPCWHQKKRAEFQSGRLCLPNSVTNQRSYKVQSQRQASTSIHRTVPNLGKMWRSGLPTQPTREPVSGAWCFPCVSAEEMFASARRAIANQGPWSSGRPDIYREANPSSRDSR
jgi:hypothetical protein